MTPNRAMQYPNFCKLPLAEVETVQKMNLNHTPEKAKKGSMNRDKEDIKDRLEEYLEGKGIDTRKPFHCLNPDHDDTRPSMSFYKEGRIVKCFSCNATYDIFGLIGLDYGLVDFKDQLQKGKEIFSIVERTPQRKPQKKAQTDQGSYTANAHSRIGQTDYPERRGLSQAIVERFKLGYDPAFNVGGGQQWEAFIIPTSDTSYTARNTDPEAGKADRIRKTGASPLFNIEAIESGEPVFIVEGEIDAMSIVQAGGQAVGLGSTANYMGLVDLLRANPPDNPILLALDNDVAGQETTKKLAAELDKLGISFFSVDIAGEYNDPNEALQKDMEGFTERIGQAKLAQQEELEREIQEYKRTSAAGSINSFIDGIQASANTPATSTGFTKLDNVLDGGLYEGLYIVGAISSLGKTTLITQIGDQIAQAGRDVLLFSLEMAKTEIMAKSISRMTYINDRREAKTTRGITDGKRWESYSEEGTSLLYKSIVDYGGYATRIYIHEGMGNIGVESIRQTISRHKRVTGNDPVVIIDYLQILAPASDRATDKQNTDRAVMELKRISRDYKIPIIGISSFNRQSYKDTVAMEAFKESGAIEYSSDVLIGLQLEGAGSKDFDVDEEKRRDPRKVQLKVLKNRNGRSGDTLNYDYFPAYNYFVEGQQTYRESSTVKEQPKTTKESWGVRQ